MSTVLIKNMECHFHCHQMTGHDASKLGTPSGAWVVTHLLCLLIKDHKFKIHDKRKSLNIPSSAFRIKLKAFRDSPDNLTRDKRTTYDC